VGEGADYPENEGWVAVLHAKLPKGTTLHRLGVSGSTAEAAIYEQVSRAEALEPSLVTIWLVVNDFRVKVPLSDYRLHLDEIVSRMTATGATVLVGNMPELTSMPEFSDTHPDELRRATAEWNSAIKEVVTLRGAVLVDLLAASEEMEGDTSMLLSEDGFHPSTLGHLVLAEIFHHYYELVSSQTAERQ
jgi:lysophospholipase L1-like esterase